jgi:hypothetical protein
MMKPAIAVFITVLLVAPALCAAEETLRPLDLIEHAERYLRRTVAMDIVEPLRGPTTKESLSRAQYGQVEVAIPEGSAGSLALVPANFHPNDPARYRGKFDRVLTSPLRVRGELLRDDEMSRDKRAAYVFRVATSETLTLEPPLAVRSVAEIAADPKRFDRRQIEYEGMYRHGFEISALDKEIWLATDVATTYVGRPAGGGTPAAPRRVRVTGILFAHPGAHYGHLGGHRYQLQAIRLEYLP